MCTVVTYSVEYQRFLNTEGIKIYIEQWQSTYDSVYAEVYKSSYEHYARINMIRAQYGIEPPDLDKTV